MLGSDRCIQSMGGLVDAKDGFWLPEKMKVDDPVSGEARSMVEPGGLPRVLISSRRTLSWGASL